MKIIALIPFKNEEHFLPTCISSIKNCVDDIVAVDDGSTDSSREILETAGVKVYDSDNPGKSAEIKGKRHEAGWDEIAVRQSLLDKGRSAGGTHFLCLDADEAITTPLAKNLREICRELSPKEYVNIMWLSVWESLNKYTDTSTLGTAPSVMGLFQDDQKYNFTTHAVHNGSGMHVNRVPSITLFRPQRGLRFNQHPPDGRFILDQNQGALLHYAWLFWHNMQLKQCWYRVSEFLVRGPRSRKKVNSMYLSGRDPKPSGPILDIPTEWVDGIVQPKAHPSDILRKDLLDSTVKQFDRMGIKWFEGLDIWHVKELREEFVKRKGREPKG
jgi:hypothetical protein